MAVDFPQRAVHGGLGKRQQEKTSKQVLDFSASVNPFPPAIDQDCNAPDLSVYPDDNYTCLKERIGRAYSRDPEEICVGNGSIEIIRAFCSVILGERAKNRLFFTGVPTFGEYELSAGLAGARRTDIPGKAGVRFICNPNNPTGELIGRADLIKILESTGRGNGILFCDEAFIDLADPGESIADIRNPHLFVLKSLTKSFAVPGLRIGFGFGDPLLVEKIETARNPWCVNAYAEAFAMEAVLHLDDLADSRRKIHHERERLVPVLHNLGLICRPSSANYLLAECGRDAAPLCDALARRDILVRDCTSFGLPTCIRIAIRTPDENSQLIEALTACMH